MRILEPNIEGRDIEFINKNSIYISITDFSAKSMLREIIYGPAQKTWYWDDIKNKFLIDVNPLHSAIMDFNEIINRAINNVYCTVYEFKNIEKVFEKWNDIVYIDKRKTIYKGQ